MPIKTRKIKVSVIFGFTILMLSSCGDDINVNVPVMKLSDFAQPISSEQWQQREMEKLKNSAEPDGQEENHSLGDQTDTGEPAAGTSEALADPEDEAAGPDDTVTITISAAGDVTLGTHQNQDYYYSFRQAYDQADGEGYFFENVSDVFREDDLTIVNLEGALTFSENMTEGLTYNIKGDPEYARLLPAGYIEAVSMGNNHRLDYGEEATQDTVDALVDAGIVYAYDDNVGIYETKGIRIGFVSVNEVYWGAGVEKTLQSGIEKLQEEDVDLILACCHWGTEREYYPEDYQTTLGRKCIDWGADLVIGHHPHVLQGVDRYQGKYIIYSLGNFCFGANRNPEDKDTMIFQQTFTFVNGEKQDVEDVRIIPCSISSVSTRNDFRPTVATGEEAKRIIDRVNEFSEGFGVQFAEDGSVIP